MDQIATFQELLNSLPDDEKTGEVIQRLRICYEIETALLYKYASGVENSFMTLLPFVKQGSQYIAVFWVNDLDLPKEEQFNWHLQNASQWLYAGCILVQDGKVSTHH